MLADIRRNNEVLSKIRLCQQELSIYSERINKEEEFVISVGLDLVIDALIYRQEHFDIQRIVAAEAQEVGNINKEDTPRRK